jgi:YfiH family protein
MIKASNLVNKHGFFTRQGGVSEGVYASLNVGFNSGDERDRVIKNREIAREKIGAEKLVTISQIHSNIAVFVEGEGSFEGDALVTNKPNIAIGILTADCTPILFEDAKNGIVAAAHAGWKGARFGIIENTLKLMKEKGAVDICAAIGPCIAQNSYEIDKNFYENFLSENSENKKYFYESSKLGHFMFNLPHYIEDKLTKSGINNIVNLAEDTLSQPQKFFSHRRGTLSGNPEKGRQISVICFVV